MSKPNKRKVGFFYLSLSNNDGELEIKEQLIKIINFICSKSKRARKQDLGSDKFCLLESSRYIERDDSLELLIKSAKHSYRAPLINKQTVEERENPKTLDEGECRKTHFIINFKDGDAIVFQETYGGALSMKNFVEYLNYFIQKYNNEHVRLQLNYYYKFDIIPRDDFEEVLNNMQRVKCATVYIEKRILGGAALNYSNRIEEVQDNIIVEIKAERTKNIKPTVLDIFRFFGIRNEISKIRVAGNSDNNEVIIDTDFIGKKEYVTVSQNKDTGEINSLDMFTQLLELARTI